MDSLFEAQVGGQSYSVTFSDERYHFTPSGGGPAFSLLRTHDEWQTEGPLPGSGPAEAIAALEAYLLRQH